MPVGARLLAHLHTGPGAHPGSCTMGSGSYLGVKRQGRGSNHTPLLVSRSRKSKAIPVSLRVCYGVSLPFFIDPVGLVLFDI
jgi:hypothetical protein